MWLGYRAVDGHGGPYKRTINIVPVVKLPYRAYLGVDPGQNGGLALLLGERVLMTPMHGTYLGLWDWFRRLVDYVPAEDTVAVLEQVSGYAPWKGTQPGKSMFRFGESYGALQLALTAAGISYQLVTPSVWQARLGIEPREYVKKGRKKQYLESPGQFKARLRAFAVSLFPLNRPTLQIADALLLAEYCRRENTGAAEQAGSK